MIFLVILCITYKFAEFDLYHRDMYLVIYYFNSASKFYPYRLFNLLNVGNSVEYFNI